MLRSKLPPDSIVEKTHFSAVTEGVLLLRQQWIVAGTEAHVCMRAADGIRSPCGGSRRPRDKELALRRMEQNGAEIMSREMVAFEWLESAEAPMFREVHRCFIR